MYGIRIDCDEMQPASGDGWTGYGDEPSVSIEAPDEDRDCPECGAYIEADAAVTEDDDGNERAEGHDEDCREPSWRPAETIAQHFNAAGVDVRSDSQVDLWVSIGDPRGAFVMRLELVETDDGPELRLGVPHPSGSMNHMGLVPLASDGYYRVVGQQPSGLPSLHHAARAVLVDLAHYVSTHGPGPDKRLADLRAALGMTG